MPTAEDNNKTPPGGEKLEKDINNNKHSMPISVQDVDMSVAGGEDQEIVENLLHSNKKISKNDFNFIKVIGRGSFGKVYLVKKKDKLDVPYALKILNKDVVSKRNLMIKTQAERDILEKIVSPFIVKLHYAF